MDQQFYYASPFSASTSNLYNNLAKALWTVCAFPYSYQAPQNFRSKSFMIIGNKKLEFLFEIFFLNFVWEFFLNFLLWKLEKKFETFFWIIFLDFFVVKTRSDAELNEFFLIRAHCSIVTVVCIFNKNTLTALRKSLGIQVFFGK
jgi:hypothetical protein